MQEILSKATIALRIRDLRQNSGFSQQLVANYLGLSRSNYSQIELGNQFPTYDALTRLAIFYDKSYEWILHGRKLGLGSRPGSAQIPFPNQPLRDITSDREKTVVRLVQNSDYYSYLNSIHDPEYISTLTQLKTPAKATAMSVYRAFQVTDESMEGGYLKDDVVLTASLSNISEIKSEETYIIVTTDEILLRKAAVYIKDLDLLIAKAENPNYPVAPIPLDAIQEIWQVCGIFSTPLSTIVEKMGREIEKFEYSIFKIRQEINFIQQKERKKVRAEEVDA